MAVHPIFLGLSLLSSTPDAALLSQSTVDYQLEAKLDPDARTVETRGRVMWRNGGSRPIRSLWWHLYLNAFRNDRSTFMRELSSAPDYGPEDWGYTTVTKMTARPVGTATVAPVDLLSGRVFEHPDDDNVEDRTVMRTPLPFSVPPGQAVEIEVAFVARLPKVIARTGHARGFFLVAQWFPKLGVLQETFRKPPAGEPLPVDAYGEPAWNCHQFHANGEFFADYGRYDVTLSVPEGFVVGATGTRTRAEPGPDGMMVYNYVQDRVHDFAWTVDRRFIEETRTFRMADQVSPAERVEVAGLLGLPEKDLALPDVEVTLLIQPEHAVYGERYFRATFEAIKWFGLWYGPYPYETLTVVDGPRGAGAAMGMEYPTFIAGGVSWPAPDSLARPENVTIHEFGHQYWYGLVGTNEFEESWLDEGFNTYSTGKVVDRAYPPFISVVRNRVFGLHWWVPGWRLTAPEQVRLRTMAGPDKDQIVRPIWQFRDRRSSRINSYPRPALVLHQLEAELGPKTMARAMRRYATQYRYRHPTTEDFIAVVEAEAGRPMQPFFDRTVYSEGKVDYEIDEIKTRRRLAPLGVFDGSEEAPNEVRVVTERKDEGEAVYETTVVVERRGDVDMPVTVEVVFEDGTRHHRTWDGRYRWHRFHFEGKSPAVSAHLWPDKPMWLDMRPSNDTMRTDGRMMAGLTWGAHALYLVQTILQLLGGLL